MVLCVVGGFEVTGGESQRNEVYTGFRSEYHNWQPLWVPRISYPLEVLSRFRDGPLRWSNKTATPSTFCPNPTMGNIYRSRTSYHPSLAPHRRCAARDNAEAPAHLPSYFKRWGHPFLKGSPSHNSMSIPTHVPPNHSSFVI